ncbi:hypothetical protein AHAS_Ahas16G0039400 [Arachis hypogaea]
MPAMLRDWDLCCGLQTLTKSVSPAACFKATDESHRTSSATAVAATKVQSSSFQASSLSIAACAIRVHGKGSWEQIFFGLICQIHLKIGGSSQEEISLGFMSLFLSLILGNNKLVRIFCDVGVMDEDLFLMVRSGVCSDGGGTTSVILLKENLPIAMREGICSWLYTRLCSGLEKGKASLKRLTRSLKLKFDDANAFEDESASGEGVQVTWFCMSFN